MGNDSKIVVPYGMKNAAFGAVEYPHVNKEKLEQIEKSLEAALRWQKEKLSESNVEFHRAILAAERERFPGSDEEGSVVAQRVGFEYGISFARNYIREMFMGESQ